MNSTSPLSRNGSNSQSLISTTIPADPTPIDVLLQTPPAVLRLLTLASPIIESTLTFVELITWTHPSFFSSLLVLFSWWGICLFGPLVLRYGLPSILLVYVLANYISNISTRNTPVHPPRHHSRPLTLTPSSYAHLLQSSQSLATQIHLLRTGVIYPLTALMSFTPQRAGRAAPVYHTAWFAITSYPVYLLLTWFVPMRMILLAVGSVGILWNAPFFINARSILWQSAAVRWSCRILISLLRGGRGLKKEWSRTKSGVGIPSLLGRLKGSKGEERPVKARSNSSLDGIVEEGKEEIVEGDDVKLQFTVFENQRWWVGLDWTHALLPGERASWTDPALNPSSPPSSFSLPPPTVIYTPSPSKTDSHARLKTTTEWKWLDPEWKVLRTSTAPLSPTTTSSPPLLGLLPKSISSTSTFTSSTPSIPTLPPASPLAINTSSPLLPSNPSSSSISSTAASAPTLLSEELLIQNWQVDDDGWQYGDNHFEKMGAKGGLGKFTRRRAWIRSAGLVERCEKVNGERVVEKVATTGTGITSAVNGTAIPSSTGMTRVGSLKNRRESGSKEREKRSESPSLEGDIRKRKPSSSTLKNPTASLDE